MRSWQSFHLLSSSLFSASSVTTKIVPGCDSLLPRAAAGTVHFQFFLNTELQTPGRKNSNKISEKEQQCLNGVLSSGTHCDFASRALSVPNPLQGTSLVHTEWNPGIVTAQEGKEAFRNHQICEIINLMWGFQYGAWKCFQSLVAGLKHIHVFFQKQCKSLGVWKVSTKAAHFRSTVSCSYFEEFVKNK